MCIRDSKYGYDDAAVLSYFVEKGMTYHQQASAEFDPVSYRFEYADLRKAYGDTWAGYYNHYVRWGKAAGLHGTGCTEMKGYVTVYGGLDYASVYDYNYYSRTCNLNRFLLIAGLQLFQL